MHNNDCRMDPWEHVKGTDDDRSRNIHTLEEEKKQVACEYLALMAKYER